MSDDVVKKHSAGGLLTHEGKFLIIHWVSQNTYELPKGTIDNGEAIEAACLREIKEETGYDASILTHLSTAHIDYVWSDGIHYQKTIDYFLMRPTDLTETPAREEHEDFTNLWCTYDEAKDLLTFDHAVKALELADTYLAEHGVK